MWRIIGASERGTSHEAGGTPCQDANLSEKLPPPANLALAAVADGLGTAARSELGSQTAVRAVVASLVEQLTRPTDGPRPPGDEEQMKKHMDQAFAAARHRLEETAAAESLALRDLGTTLMAVVCSPHWTLVGHIGDGVIIGEADDGALEILSEPQRGEYANVTMPLTMDNALQRVQTRFLLRAPRVVMLMSDGLQNLALDLRANVPFAGFVRPLIDGIGRAEGLDVDQANQRLSDFLNSDRLNQRTDDDKTLVMIVREAVPPPKLGQVDIPLPPDAEAEAPTDPHMPIPKATAPAAASPAPPSDDQLKAAQLEAEAEELEREAEASKQKALEYVKGLDPRSVRNDIERGMWEAFHKMFDVAKEQRKEAAKKREEAQALRQGKRPGKLRGLRRNPFQRD